MFKKLGRILSAPVRVPMRKLKEKAMARMIEKLLRYALTAVGASAVSVTDNDIAQVVGAIATVGGFVWSVIQDIREQRAKQQPVGAK
jgi:hypothetical protein